MKMPSTVAGAPIALVEDNLSLRTELVFHLNCAGFRVTGLADGAALDKHLSSQPCHLIVLDLGLPGEDGLSICRRVRVSRPEIGIVMLTARGMAADRLIGLQDGADAYLVKPTPPDELLAVIRNLLCRLQPAPLPVPPHVWHFDPVTLRLVSPDGSVLLLTHSESLLLQTLLRYAPGPASRRQLIEALGGSYLDFDERRLEMAVSRLRRKLGQLGSADEPLRAARGVGYQLTVPCVLQST
jgi:DNA-binding response OmpR family regulator